MLYHTVLYPTVLYHTWLYRIVLYHTVLYHTMLYHTMLNHTVQHHIVPHYKVVERAGLDISLTQTNPNQPANLEQIQLKILIEISFICMFVCPIMHIVHGAWCMVHGA